MITDRTTTDDNIMFVVSSMKTKDNEITFGCEKHPEKHRAQIFHHIARNGRI